MVYLTYLTAAHVEDISTIEMRLFDNWFGPSQLRAELDTGIGIGLVQDYRIIAYILLRKDKDIVDITRLAVDEDHQRLGYGTALLQYALMAVHSKKYVLDVLRDNYHAFKLYKSEGFKVIGTLGQAWVMLRSAHDGDAILPTTDITA